MYHFFPTLKIKISNISIFRRFSFLLNYIGKPSNIFTKNKGLDSHNYFITELRKRKFLQILIIDPLKPWKSITWFVNTIVCFKCNQKHSCWVLCENSYLLSFRKKSSIFDTVLNRPLKWKKDSQKTISKQPLYWT